jgi:hypothetical protein
MNIFSDDIPTWISIQCTITFSRRVSPLVTTHCSHFCHLVLSQSVEYFEAFCALSRFHSVEYSAASLSVCIATNYSVLLVTVYRLQLLYSNVLPSLWLPQTRLIFNFQPSVIEVIFALTSSSRSNIIALNYIHVASWFDPRRCRAPSLTHSLFLLLNNMFLTFLLELYSWWCTLFTLDKYCSLFIDSVSI